ncbi:hypothetical protein [Streptomyces luteogriseus]|uniref:hypothetical protein n=1 Tax=Streptomyces luteogriseus TaxID=68233 RepID=UPI0033C3F845
MPPKDRTPDATALQDVGRKAGNDAPAASAESSGYASRGWKKRQVTFWTPPVPPATGLGVGAGSSWFTVALATENVHPGYVWPSLVFIGMGMAYDLGRRFLDRARKP